MSNKSSQHAITIAFDCMSKAANGKTNDVTKLTFSLRISSLGVFRETDSDDMIDGLTG